MVKKDLSRSVIYMLLGTGLLIILAGGCSYNTDYFNYKELYLTTISTVMLGIEPGYSILQGFCYKIGVSYENFRFIIFVFFVIVLNSIVYRKIGSKVLLFDILFVFFPLPYDVLNIRNCIAEAIFLISFFWCIETKRKHYYIGYILGCILASCFHRTALFYLIFLYAFYKSRRTCKYTKFQNYSILYFSIFLAIVGLLLTRGLLAEIIILIAKMVNLPAAKLIYFIPSVRFGWILFLACHYCFFILIAYCRRAYINSILIKQQKTVSLQLIETVYICNILLLCFVPLLFINTELYRIYRGFVAIEYITFFVSREYITRWQTKFTADCILIVAIIVNFMVEIYPYMAKIFIPMFKNNRFF